jgi:hypothetical protein
MKKFKLIVIIFGLFSCIACNKFSIQNIEILNNLKEESNILNVDLKDALSKGIIVPSSRQTDNGFFNFKFTIKNPEKNKYYYKIYYQNSSYQYPLNVDSSSLYNKLCSENFYGSWETTEIGFKELETDENSNDIDVLDSFRIVGNPRNEEKYFGQEFTKFKISESAIQEKINSIKGTPEWLNAIKKKAADGNKSLEEQLYLDAKWVISSELNKGNSNNRWKRNPRMGNYDFIIVIADDEGLSKIPDYIQNISQLGPDGYFVNPFYYFKYKVNPDSTKGISTFYFENKLSLKTIITPEKGIYINSNERPPNIDKSNFCNECNESDDKFNNALFEENYHSTINEHKIPTIPLISDLDANEYTLSDYLSNDTKSLKLKPQNIHYGSKPCEYIKQKNNYIELINKGNNNLELAEKRNIGVKTRVGFTYGKITAKVKFPSLLNATNVWNGLTNAVWLLYQDKDQWNNRRITATGYTEKGSYSADAPRITNTSYSEIDFEIVKASKNWPDQSYKNNIPQKIDDQKNSNIIVALTNWDLCNKDPKKYFSGVDSVPHLNKKFEANRWADYYQALTMRHEDKNAELFGKDYYYYQIEWKPGEIIWRIGANKNNMREIGYMNDDYTNIPNNQMVMLITQEYHMSEWWPVIPFKQELIPFPKKDLVGKVFSIEIE